MNRKVFEDAWDVAHTEPLIIIPNKTDIFLDTHDRCVA